MTGLQQDTAVAGVQLIVPKVEFDSSIATAGGSDGGNAGLVSVVPSHFLVKSISDDVKLGFSVAGTMGGGLDYGKDFVGRYGAYRAVLAGLALSPSIGYRVNADRSATGSTQTSRWVPVCRRYTRVSTRTSRCASPANLMAGSASTRSTTGVSPASSA
jgi:long-subunit fatty acid transport protein